MATAKKKTTIQDWTPLVERRFRKLIEVASSARELQKIGPQKSMHGEWYADIKLVGRQKIQELNALYRKKNSVTDVLSFTACEPFYSQGFLGEIMICLPVARAQAKEQGHSLDMELQILMTHGLLHLLGLDHELGRSEAERMAQWEKKLLSRTALKSWIPSLSKKRSPALRGLTERNT